MVLLCLSNTINISSDDGCDDGLNSISIAYLTVKLVEFRQILSGPAPNKSGSPQTGAATAQKQQMVHCFQFEGVKLWS